MITFQQKLGYQFKDVAHLTMALTHRSYVNEHNPKSSAHNERLEFLGDAVLDLSLAEIIMAKHQDLKEGDLSKLRASLVNESALSELAISLGIDDLLLLGKGEIRSGGAKKPRLLAGAFEAVIGAMFVESGYNVCRDIIAQLFQPQMDALDLDSCFARDFKTRFQEFAQERYRATPVYAVTNEEGPDHEKTFSVEVRVGEKVLGVGIGRSKKQAEQDAARQALEVSP